MLNNLSKLNSQYKIYNPHTGDVALSSDIIFPQEYPWVQITAIDPAIKNCAIRVERRTFMGDKILYQTLVQAKLDFSTKIDGESDICNEKMYYVRANKLLSNYIEYFRTSQYIVVEKQINDNTDMVKMGQHILSFIMLYIENQSLKPLIIEIESRMKTQILNAPAKMKKDERKKWAVEKALSILESYGDIETADMIRRAKKKDDHGDVICYTEIWWYYLQWLITSKNITDTSINYNTLFHNNKNLYSTI
jgi:hypothetical protein